MRGMMLALVVVAATGGCASDTIDNTAYRRLSDSFDTYDQCLSEGNFAPCYQTLTFCADGRANLLLDYRLEGKYIVRENEAIATLPTMTLHFDLETASSTQLPGRHEWELVAPVYYDCALPGQ
jgi:hypothetical protein